MNKDTQKEKMKFLKQNKKCSDKTMFTAENPRGKLLDTSERGPRKILVDVESF